MTTKKKNTAGSCHDLSPRSAHKAGKFTLSGKLPFLKKKKEAEADEDSSGQTGEKDVLSLALERSFGTATDDRQEPAFGVFDTETPVCGTDSGNAPKFSISLPETDSTSDLISGPDDDSTPELMIEPRETGKTPAKRAPYAEMSSTQRTLDNLRKEWEELKKAEGSSYGTSPAAGKPSATEKEEDSFAYPFGGWTNEENYHK